MLLLLRHHCNSSVLSLRLGALFICGTYGIDGIRGEVLQSVLL